MIPMMNVRRICLIHLKVDFRQNHDGLLGEAYKLGLAPYQGDMIIFIGRRKDRLKILFADPNGMWVAYKRFHKGSLSKNFKFLEDPRVTEVSPVQVMGLIEGSNSDRKIIPK